MKTSFLVFFFISSFISCAQEITYPPQGAKDYAHAAVTFTDFADKPDGYWLFEPAQPIPTSANVIVFNHGYGAYNPMIYGQWIKHLVLQGNIVIYPRYQRNLFTPQPNKFAKNAAQGIRDALVELQNGKHPKPITDNLALIGHSYGGVISSDLAINYESFDIPQPKFVLMCSPGTGLFKGGRLDSYEAMPAETKLIIMTSEKDIVVGDEFAWLVYKTATNTPDRVLIQQFEDKHGTKSIRAGHNECYSLAYDFDTGVRNVTAKRAVRVSELNPLDYNGYWKLFDQAFECIQSDPCLPEMHLSNIDGTLGEWSDGTPIKPLILHRPKEINSVVTEK